MHLALCSALVFWTGPNADQLDRLFRGSGLMTPKWERPDYRERTISQAFEGARFYDPERVTRGVDRPLEVVELANGRSKQNRPSQRTPVWGWRRRV